MEDHKDKSFIYNANSLRDSIPPFRTWICKAIKHHLKSFLFVIHPVLYLTK